MKLRVDRCVDGEMLSRCLRREKQGADVWNTQELPLTWRRHEPEAKGIETLCCKKTLPCAYF